MPIFRTLYFFFEAVAILDIPYFSWQMTILNRIMLVETFSYICAAAFALLSASFLSRWVYGLGPFQALKSEAAKFRGDHNA